MDAILGKSWNVAGNGSEESDCRRDGSDACSYSSLRKTICSLQKDESGKPIQKCEKTSQLLRKCVGRPQEIVDSQVEITEEDVSTSHRPFALDFDDRKGGNHASRQLHGRYGTGEEGSGELYPFRGLFERSGPRFAGAFEEFVRAAEDAAQDVFAPFGVPEDDHQGQPRSRAEHPFGWWFRADLGGDPNCKFPEDRQADSQQSQQRQAPDYESLARGIHEV